MYGKCGGDVPLRHEGRSAKIEGSASGLLLTLASQYGATKETICQQRIQNGRSPKIKVEGLLSLSTRRMRDRERERERETKYVTPTRS